MQLTRRNVIVGAAATALTSACNLKSANSVAIPGQWTEVTRLLRGYVDEGRYAGVAAALSYEGDPVSIVTAGSLAFEPSEAVTPDSLFRLYSLTKTVTGAAAMLLVEDGLIALDQPVGDVLPELAAMQVAVRPAESLESRPAIQPLTMRQLLTHTSGLSNWQPFLGNTPVAVAYRARGLTPGFFGRHRSRPGFGPQVEGLSALVKGVAALPLIAEPGAAWNYSMGLDIMAAVIERATGKGADVFMRERLFEPLGMRSTGFQVAASEAPRMTTLYEQSNEGLSVIDSDVGSEWYQAPNLLAGGGGLISSARDFIRFAMMLIGGGKFDGQRVMQADTAQLALSSILPPGALYLPTGGYSALGPVVMPGVTSELGPPGTLSAVGASSTLLTLDPSRKGAVVFLAQMNLVGQPPAVATRFRRELQQAVEADLAASSKPAL